MADFGDIERLKKMNQMIPELKKYGFATFNDEAAQLSQDYLKEEIPVAPPKVSQKSSEDSALATNFEKFKGHVNQRLVVVEGNVQQVIEKMNEIIKSINALEKKSKAFTPSNEVPRSAEPQQEVPQSQQQKKDSEKSQQSQGQSRSGDYEPGDIDIGEVFYSGNK